MLIGRVGKVKFINFYLKCIQIVIKVYTFFLFVWYNVSMVEIKDRHISNDKE